MRILTTSLIVSILILIICDLSFYAIFKRYFRKWMKVISFSFMIFSFAGIIGLPFLMRNQNVIDSALIFRYAVPFYILCYIPRILFLIIYALQRLLAWLTHESKKTSAMVAGVFGLFLFVAALYGLSWGRSDYKMRTYELTFNNLPKSFDGFTIIQLSDLHVGSLHTDFQGIHKLISMINAENPDVILFTGDMVNSTSEELKPWIDELSGLKAKYGVFSVTGNHDYGLYHHWNSSTEQKKNLNDFQTYMKDAGFKMLMNESYEITINNQHIFLIGVENWGNPPYPKYGQLNKALKGTEGAFKVLMSHDPSHWNAEAIDRQIPLTLSGHTHAMQMGIKIGSFQWSPAIFLYPEYDGLYEKKGSRIVISRGQGYIGYPGRLGLRPQFDKIILRCVN